MLASRLPERSANENKIFQENFYLKRMKRSARDPLEGVQLPIGRDPLDNESLWSLTPSIRTNWTRPSLSSGRATPEPPSRFVPTRSPIPIRGQLMEPENPYFQRNPPNQHVSVLIDPIPVQNRRRYWPQYRIDRRHSYPQNRVDGLREEFSRELENMNLRSINHAIGRLEQSIETRHQFLTAVILMLIGTLYMLVILYIIDKN